MTRFLSRVLALLLLALPAAAQPIYESGDYAYIINTNDTNTITIIGYSYSGVVSANMIIPTNLDNFLITGIGDGSFQNDTLITNVTILDSVTTIGNYAFQNCSNLVSVTIPDSVTNIGYTEFWQCSSLASVTLGSNVVSFGPDAFYDCTNLTSITMPASVTDISSGIFWGCTSLGSVTLLGNVTNIEGAAFYQCYSLTNFTIPAGLTSIGGSAFALCVSLTNISIPNGVTSLGDGAFYDCQRLSHVTVPESVTNIGPSAFWGCDSLTNVSLPSHIPDIGNFTFSFCGRLTNITIPASVTNIGTNAFAYSFWASVFFMGNAPAVDSTAFISNPKVKIYYLPGTTGWSNTFAGAPAVLWNALIQTGDGSFGFTNQHFGFNIKGATNLPIVVEACTNLADADWTPVQAFTLTNVLFYFSEAALMSNSGRFYRLRPY